MVNHKSVAGLTKQEVVQIVRSSSPNVHFLVAREVRLYCTLILIVTQCFTDAWLEIFIDNLTGIDRNS